MTEKFKAFLSRHNLAANTIRPYVWTVTFFLKKYGEVTRKNLLVYKGFLMERYKPQTVNLRIQALNKYLEFIKKGKLRLKFVKVQQKNFLDNVISDADPKEERFAGSTYRSGFRKKLSHGSPPDASIPAISFSTIWARGSRPEELPSSSKFSQRNTASTRQWSIPTRSGIASPKTFSSASRCLRILSDRASSPYHPGSGTVAAAK